MATAEEVASEVDMDAYFFCRACHARHDCDNDDQAIKEAGEVLLERGWDVVGGNLYCDQCKNKRGLT